MTIKGILRTVASARGRAALSLGLVLSIGATGTFAFWTDSATISGTMFTAGRIDIDAALSPSTSLSVNNMLPGISVAGTLVITNSGTAPLKYTAVTTASVDAKNLAGSLAVKVTGDASATGGLTCAGTALSGSAGTLNGSLISTGRQLAAGASETLCVQLTLSPSAPTSVQGGSTNVDFTFTGTSDLT